MRERRGCRHDWDAWVERSFCPSPLAAGVYGFSSAGLCFSSGCYSTITASGVPVYAGTVTSITGQWESGSFFLYFIAGDTGTSNSIIRMASVSPYTSSVLATSAGVGYPNDLYRGIVLSPAPPVVAPPIVALRITNGGAALGTTTGNAIVVDQYNGTALTSSTPIPPSGCSLDGAVADGAYVYEGRIMPSVDALSVTLGCFATAAGIAVSGTARAIVSMNASNAVAAPLSTYVAGAGLMTVIKAASGAYYVGAVNGLSYVSPAGITTSLSAQYDITAVAIYAGSLWVASPSSGYGVYLAGSAGVLPTSATVAYTQVTGAYDAHQWTSRLDARWDEGKAYIERPPFALVQLRFSVRHDDLDHGRGLQRRCVGAAGCSKARMFGSSLRPLHCRVQLGYTAFSLRRSATRRAATRASQRAAYQCLRALLRPSQGRLRLASSPSTSSLGTRAQATASGACRRRRPWP